MINEKVENDNEDVLKIVNEDWPMLEELGKKRFVINKKKTKDIQESINVLQSVLEEDRLYENQNNKIITDIPSIDSEKVDLPVFQKVQDEKIVVAKEVAQTPSSQTQKLATTISHSIEVEENQPTVGIQLEKTIEWGQSQKSSKAIKVEKEIGQENSLDVIKFIFAGLTHLYVSKTSNLLKPIRFVIDNYKEVATAALHFMVPLLMTYYMTTQIGFVSNQLVRETTVMKLLYVGVFFFGSTFVWITGQAILSGIFSMIRKSMLDVAKVGKENK